MANAITHDLGAYSISHYLCPPGLGLVDFLDRIAVRGFGGTGLTLRALEELPTPALRRELAARGLGVTSVNSAGYFLNDDPALAAAQERRNLWLLEKTRDLDAHALNVIVGGPGQGRMALAEARSRAIDALYRLAVRAETLGVRLIVEPVHPAAIWLKGCLNTIRQVEDAIQGLRNAAINVDLFHSWWDPDLERAIGAPRVPVGLVQICDLYAPDDGGPPRRAPFGEGNVDLGGFMELARKCAADIPVEVELFADQMPGRALDPILDSAVAFLSRRQEAKEP